MLPTPTAVSISRYSRLDVERKPSSNTGLQVYSTAVFYVLLLLLDLCRKKCPAWSLRRLLLYAFMQVVFLLARVGHLASMYGTAEVFSLSLPKLIFTTKGYVFVFIFSSKQARQYDVFFIARIIVFANGWNAPRPYMFFRECHWLDLLSLFFSMLFGSVVVVVLRRGARRGAAQRGGDAKNPEHVHARDQG